MRSFLTLLALAGALALAGCQRETAKVEPASPPAQTQIAPAPAPPAPVASSSVQGTEAAAPVMAPPPPIDRNAAELNQPPRTVVIPPEEGRRESLEAREKRLAARQAAVERRERRLRQREAERSPVPTPPPSAAESEPAAVPSADSNPQPNPELNPEPGPEPEPAPRPRIAMTLPEGTSFDVELAKTLSSASSRVGDTFRARVAADVVQDGEVAIPAGSEVVGEVTQAAPSDKKIGGRASLGIRFTDLILPSGETVPVAAALQSEGKNKGGRDAATIGGAAAGGAILGNILSHGRGGGSLIGALLGAVTGTAIAAHTKGEEVEIPQGAVVRLQLDRSVRVHREE